MSFSDKLWMLALVTCGSVATAACGGEDEVTGSGAVTVLLEPEDVVVEGLEAGAGNGDVRDGWAVDFDKYVVAIGDIQVRSSTDASVTASAPQLFAVDLTELPTSGLSLWSLSGLRSGRWEFNFRTASAADGAVRHDSVTEEDFTAMQAADATYLMEGSLTKADGRSCPPASLAQVPSGAVAAGTNDGGDACYENRTLSFSMNVPAVTRFGPCEVDGISGFAVTAGGTQTVSASIHGDHLFFNGFPEGGEGGVMRLAQWLADCDLNVDGNVTREELEAIAPSALSELDERYQLGGSPITPLDTMWDYVAAQLKTQGHFQGEGECPLDGP
jgi:hypothetical protein